MSRLLTFLTTLLLALLLTTTLTVHSAAAAPADTASDDTLTASAATPAAVTLAPAEAQVFHILMQQRLAEGAALPTLDPVLMQIAQQRVTDMATQGYFSHYAPDGSTVFSLLNASGTDWAYAGEIISRNNYSADQSPAIAGQAFLNSAAHHAVAVDPQYGRVGIAHAVSANGMHYYAVIFVRR